MRTQQDRILVWSTIAFFIIVPLGFLLSRGWLPGTLHLGILVDSVSRTCKDYAWAQPVHKMPNQRPQKVDGLDVYYGSEEPPIGSTDGITYIPRFIAQTPFGKCNAANSQECCQKLGLVYQGVHSAYSGQLMSNFLPSLLLVLLAVVGVLIASRKSFRGKTKTPGGQ